MLETVGKVISLLTKPAWDKLTREDRTLKVLQSLGLNDGNPPTDFEGVYAHALVHYGADKSKTVLELFRELDVIRVFREAFTANDKHGLQADAARFTARHRLGDQLRAEGINVAREVDEFFEIFRLVAVRSQTPAQAHLSHALAELRSLKEEARQLQEQTRVDLARFRLEEIERSEARYRQLALEACDIIDLAGLPEDDRHVAMMKFVMRQLYVPLRLQIEATPALEAIEFARTALRKAEASRAGMGAQEGEENLRKRISLGELLSTRHRVVVLGDPGGGKSTLVRWLATAYLLRLKRDPHAGALPDVETLPATEFLPIVIRCRELDHSSLTGALDDMLRQTLRKAEMAPEEAAVLPVVLRKRLAAGTALLLIDGLDEITDTRVRSGFCRQIERVSIAFPAAPIVVTSRIVGYREMGIRIGQGFAHYSLAELSPEDKDLFAERWCELTEPVERRSRKLQELIQDIHSTDRIERLTGNPMLLTTMALVKRKVGKLPSRRAELYREAVQVLLNWRREVDEPLDAREALPQLEYLAYEMCRRGEQSLTEPDALALLERMRAEYPNIRPIQKHTPEQFLHILEQRTSLLIQSGHVRRDGQMVPVYEFRHLTFQEYLAGLALVEGRFPGHDRSRSLAERVAPLVLTAAEGVDRHSRATSNWREALRLCVASCNDDDTDDVLLTILTPLPGERAEQTARARALLAGLCLADEPNTSEQTGRQVLNALVKNIREADGGGLSETGMEKVARELGASEWGSRFGDMLVQEFRSATGREWVACGGLCAYLDHSIVRSHGGSDIDDWLTNQEQELSCGEEHRALRAALSLMNFYYEEKNTKRNFPPIKNIVERSIQTAKALLPMLTGSSPAVHAAAWALLWVLDGEIAEKINQEIPWLNSLLIEALSRQDLRSGAIRYILSILSDIPTREAAQAVSAYIYFEKENIQQAAFDALLRAGSEPAREIIQECFKESDKMKRCIAAIRWAECASPFIEKQRILLSQDFNGMAPGWDPWEPIDGNRVRLAAKALECTETEVRNMYEKLAQEIPLRLTWREAGGSVSEDDSSQS